MDKTQTIRLLDVFLFGPIIIMGARAVKDDNLALALWMVGLGTIAFNGFNYIDERNGNGILSKMRKQQ